MKKSWDDISIREFNIIKEISSNDRVEEIDKMVDLLHIVDGEDVDYYYELPLNKLVELKSKVKFLFEPLVNNFKASFTLNNVKYNVTLNPNKLTAGQYIDLSNILASDPDNIALLLSIIVLPKGKKYGEYDIFEQEKIFDEYMPITLASGISAFFLSYYENLTNNLLTYSIRKLKREMKKKRKYSETEREQMKEVVRKLEETLISGLDLPSK